MDSARRTIRYCRLPIFTLVRLTPICKDGNRRACIDVGRPAGARGAQKGPASGLLVVFVVSDVDADHRRLMEHGVEITTPLQTEPWGERFLQVTDPNGIVIQLVQWVTSPADQPA